MNLVYALAGTLLATIATVGHAVPSPEQYTCPAGQDLTVKRSLSHAQVSFAGRTYDLQRRPSSIGEKYISPEGALIIDGDSAVFVPKSDLAAATCIKAVPLASEQ